MGKKITTLPIQEIIYQYRLTPATSYTLAEKHGVSQATIMRLIRSKVSQDEIKELRTKKASVSLSKALQRVKRTNWPPNDGSGGR